LVTWRKVANLLLYSFLCQNDLRIFSLPHWYKFITCLIVRQSSRAKEMVNLLINPWIDFQNWIVVNFLFGMCFCCCLLLLWVYFLLKISVLLIHEIVYHMPRFLLTVYVFLTTDCVNGHLFYFDLPTVNL